MEGRSLRCPRTYSVPDCRPNQKRSSMVYRLSYSGGSTRGRLRKMESRWIHRREGDRDAGPIMATDSKSLVLRCPTCRQSESLQVCEHCEGASSGELFQLCGGSQASRPVSHPTVSKNRLASKGVLLFNMVYTVRPSFWARIDRALALPYRLTSLW